jgi:hypothetical protein
LISSLLLFSPESDGAVKSPLVGHPGGRRGPEHTEMTIGIPAFAGMASFMEVWRLASSSKLSAQHVPAKEFIGNHESTP